MDGPPLRHIVRLRDFRRLLGTRACSQFGDGVLQASLAGAVLFSPERQTTAAQIAVSFAVLLLPYSLVGPFAGVFLDRWSRQRVLVMANVARAALVVMVAVLIISSPSGTAFYLAALAALSVNRFFLAALSAALPHVVTTDELVTANALATTTGTIVAGLGAVAGVGVRAGLGADDRASAVVALIAAVIYLGAAGLATRMGYRLLGPDHDPGRAATREALGHVVGDFVAGFRHVRERPSAAAALAAITSQRFFYGLTTIATVLLYRNYFTDDGFFRAGLVGLGQVFAASAAGVLLAAAVTPPVVRRIGARRWLVALFGVAAVVEAALGLPFRQPPLLLAALILGLVAQGSKISVDTVLQTTVEDDYRGRVFSLYDTLFNIAFVAAALVGAFTLPDNGKSYLALMVIAVGYAATAIGYGWATRGDRAPLHRQRPPDRADPVVATSV